MVGPTPPNLEHLSPADKARRPAKLSVVIPAYNEAGTLRELIRRVVDAVLLPNVSREIIVVDDCSTDGTAKILDDLPTLFPGTDFKIKHKPVNEGKGAALRDGFA